MSQQHLARERYRLLWDVSIDGRLNRKGCHTVATKEQRQAEFAAGFSFWADARQQAVFESLWTNSAPTHQMLLDLVSDTRAVPKAAPLPGSPCPLCGFPTFAWASASSFNEDAVSRIRLDFPHWTPEQGACARCSQIYRVNRPQAHLVA